MRIELNGFIITRLEDGRYKSTDGFALLCTHDLELALQFAEVCGQHLMGTLKIDRFRMVLDSGVFHVQREENDAGVYFQVREFDTMELPSAFDMAGYNAADYYLFLQAKASQLYANQLSYCGLPELVGSFGAMFTRIL
jgi:hypothetical protein